MKKFLRKCFRILNYIIPSEFRQHTQLEKKLSEIVIEETIENFKQKFEKAFLSTDKFGIREFAIQQALSQDLSCEFFYLEFGTFEGRGANFFAKFVKKFYTFDSFTETMNNYEQGHTTTNQSFKLKKIPKLKKNVVIVKGFVQDTVDAFLNQNNPKINFVHFDLADYPSTLFVLKKIKPFLKKNSILIFNNFYNYVGWKNGEYKALNQVLANDEYRYIGFCLRNRICVVQYK